MRQSDILFCLLHDRVDADVIAANPRPARDRLDDHHARGHRRRRRERAGGYPVTVIPAALLDDATADLAWALLFAVARRVAEGDRLMRSGTFPGSQSAYLESAGVSRKTLGLIGMGGVGRATARARTRLLDARALS